MSLQARLLTQLLRDEGLQLRPYRDTVGKLTIGVGRNLDDKGISREEALEMLDHDVSEATQSLTETLPWVTSLDEARQGVLVNMAFNLGLRGLLQFHQTLQAVENGHWQAAAQHMLDSKWAQQVGPRATRLALQMETGEWR